MMFESIFEPEFKNVEVLNALVKNSNWHLVTRGASAKAKKPFFSAVTNTDGLFKRIKLLRQITQPISQFIHHLERTGVRAS